jgi:hypothetical protein
MSEFGVQIRSLVDAGRLFQKVAVDYKGDMTGGFDGPSTGGVECDAILETTLKMIDLLHGALADAIWQHGEKLQLVAERFQKTEDANIALLYQEAVDASTTPGDMPNIRPKG